MDGGGILLGSYNTSSAYRQTVVTSDGLFQRAPLSCWYARPTATVLSVSRVLGPWYRLVGYIMQASMENAGAVDHPAGALGDHGPSGAAPPAMSCGGGHRAQPGQCASFSDGGIMVHGTIQPGGSAEDATGH